jgi:hypothetical protein
MSTSARSAPTTDNARNQKTSVEPRAAADVDAEVAMIAIAPHTCRQRSDFLRTSRFDQRHANRGRITVRRTTAGRRGGG